MKILIATPYIYKKEWPEFTRNLTGFGKMVYDIYKSVSEKEEAYLLSHVITEGHGHVLRHTWSDVFCSANIKDWIRAITYFFKYPQGIKRREKYFYYALNAGTMRKAIRTIKPDVVHLHGIGVRTKPFIEVCKEENVPYIVTLHGLIGLDESITAAQWDKDMEREFLIEAVKKNVPVTVISTGMKRRIEEKYLNFEAKNISVVCNGTRLRGNQKASSDERINIRTQFKITGEKIIVVIGSIYHNKNQKQVIKALSEGLVSVPFQLFLCGNDVSNGEIQKQISDTGMRDAVHLMGLLSPEEIGEILDQADLNVVASINEGFGLSVIEAYSHGVPTVMFADLDAVDDLYNENAMIRITSRDDRSLALGIEEALTRQWDREWIKEFAGNYSLEKMADQYITVYERLV